MKISKRQYKNQINKWTIINFLFDANRNVKSSLKSKNQNRVQHC